jgi:hypothetical protein
VSILLAPYLLVSSLGSLDPEVGGKTFFQNVCKLLSDYTASHLGREYTLYVVISLKKEHIFSPTFLILKK